MGERESDPEVSVPLPDKDTALNQDETANPFVKFRNFVDDQAGYVRTGMKTIAAWPSALISNSSLAPAQDQDSNTNIESSCWNKRMKHRAERQYRDPQLTLETTHRSSDNDKDRDDMPSTEYPPPRFDLSVEDLAFLRAMDDEGEQDGLQLYMPVTKALLGSLVTARPPQSTSGFAFGGSGFRMPRFMDFLREENAGADHMPHVRAKIFDQLGVVQHPISKMSMIPYLVHSPYSPLNLQFQIPVLSVGSQTQGSEELFPYAAPFQDLILISQCQEMRNLEDMALTKGVQKFWHSWGSEAGTQDRVNASMSWLGELSRTGLLWTRGEVAWFQSPENGSSTMAANSWEGLPHTTRHCEQQDATTELDFYEFLKESLPPGVLPTGSEIRSFVGSFEKVFNDARDDIKAFNTREAKDGNHDLATSSLAAAAIASGFAALDHLLQLFDPPHDTEFNASSSGHDSPPHKDTQQSLGTWDVNSTTAQSLRNGNKNQDEGTFQRNVPQNSDNNSQETRSSCNTNSYPGGSTTTKLIETKWSDGSWSTIAHRKVLTDGTANRIETTTTTVAKVNPNGTATVTETQEKRWEDGGRDVQKKERVYKTCPPSTEALVFFDADNPSRSSFHEVLQKRTSPPTSSTYDDDMDDDDNDDDSDDGKESEAWEAYGNMIKANMEAREEAEQRSAAAEEEARHANEEEEDKARITDRDGGNGKKRPSAGRGWFWA